MEHIYSPHISAMTIILYDIASKFPGGAWNLNPWKTRYVRTSDPRMTSINEQRFLNHRIDSASTTKAFRTKLNGLNIPKSSPIVLNMASSPPPPNPTGHPSTPSQQSTTDLLASTPPTPSLSPSTLTPHTPPRHLYSHTRLEVYKPHSKALSYLK